MPSGSPKSLSSPSGWRKAQRMTSPTTSTDPLLVWRDRFPILENSTYLVSHSLGAMPRAVRDQLTEFADRWETRGVRAWSEGWWEMPVEVGNLLARLIGAPKESVSMHMNVTLAQAIFLSALDWSGPRNRIVCTDLDFPSVLYLYQGLAAHGAEIVRVPSDDGITVDPQRVADAIDDRTAVVAVSHVIFRSGAILDVEPIVARAREHGALTLLDAYQSVATVPVDVDALGVDALTGGSVKWLCGGPGAGFLYVRPEVAEQLRPRLTGWMAHPQPFAFDPGPMEPAGGGVRFLNGTPAIPVLYAARSGYEIILRGGCRERSETSRSA